MAGNSTRLMSIDALRGFDMFWIFYPTYPVFHALLVAMGLKGCWLDLQMDHLPWIGFTFYDTIYPLFLFLAGVSFPFSYASSRAKGRTTGSIVWKIVRRAIVLVLLGSRTDHLPVAGDDGLPLRRRHEALSDAGMGRVRGPGAVCGRVLAAPLPDVP